MNINIDTEKNRRSKEEIIMELNEKFDIISDYTRLSDQITLRCKTCDKEDTKTALSFLKSGCNHCKYSETDGKSLMDHNISKIEKEFEILSEYNNVISNLTTKCKACDNVSTKIARTFILSGCQNCKELAYEEKRKEKEKLEDDLYLEKINKDKDEYKITKYSRSNYPDILADEANKIMEIEHIPCGTKTEISNRQVKVACKYCNPEDLIDADWYRKAYKKLKNNGYEVLDVVYGEYSKTKARTTNIVLKHLKCGTEFTRNSNTLKTKRGYLCPICTEGKRVHKIKKTYPQVNEDAYTE